MPIPEDGKLSTAGQSKNEVAGRKEQAPHGVVILA
jgi:hypothetical protein